MDSKKLSADWRKKITILEDCYKQGMKKPNFLVRRQAVLPPGGDPVNVGSCSICHQQLDARPVRKGEKQLMNIASSRVDHLRKPIELIQWRKVLQGDPVNVGFMLGLPGQQQQVTAQ